MRGEGPLTIRITEMRVSGIVTRAVQDGRFVTVRAPDGTEVPLRVTSDSDVEGIAERTEIKPGMWIAPLYQVPEGVNPALGYDALEFKVVP